MSFNWILPVFGKIAVMNGLFPALLKRQANLSDQPMRIWLQFFYCCIISIAIALGFGKLQISWLFAGIAGLGFANAFANIFHWRAVKISLSRTYLFSFGKDILAMVLALIILKEGRYLNLTSITGIILTVVAVILLGVHQHKNRPDRQRSPSLPTHFVFYILAFSAIWGVAMFLQKYFGFINVPTLTFLAAWYFGSLIGATLPLLVRGQAKLRTNFVGKIFRSEALGVMPLSISILVGMALAYWSYRLAPQNIVQPLFMAGEMLFPTAIGLYGFSEKKGLGSKEKLYFAMAIVGGLTIALSFR